MNKLYGRKLKLEIICNPNALLPLNVSDLTAGINVGAQPIPTLDIITIEQNGFTPESLRVTFDIDYPGLATWFYSEISIYNFNDSTAMKVIDEGARVTLSAGYQDGGFGVIFKGDVFQSLFERENVTDYKLTLRCVDGHRLFTENFSSFQLPPQHTQAAAYNLIMSKSQTPIPIGNTPSKLGTKEFPRRGVVHTTPSQATHELLRFYKVDEAANNQMYIVEGKTYVNNIADNTEEKPIIISPANGGLIGTPIQTNFGASFTCLLNPEIRLAWPTKKVKLDMSSVKQLKAVQGHNMSCLDEDQEYQVIGVRHVGDTRGNEWYTYVTGLNKGGAVDLNLAMVQENVKQGAM
jgi:hypothetical protein